MKYYCILFILFLLVPGFCAASDSLLELEKELSDMKAKKEILENELEEIESEEGISTNEDGLEYDITPEAREQIEAEQPESENYKGEIVKISRKMTDPEDEIPEEIRGIVPPADAEEMEVFTVKVLNNDKKGEEISIINDLKGNPYELELCEGDKIFLNVLKYKGQDELYVIKDFYHLDWLFVWLVVFILCVVVVGAKKGALSLLGLGISIPLIFFVYLPLIKAGFNPIILTLAVCVMITVISLTIICGFTKKTFAAALGTISGIVFSAALVLLMGWLTRLTGIADEGARIISVTFLDLNFKHIFYSGVVIGALGAVMDMSVSIISSQNEVKSQNKKISRKGMVKSGFNVGRDVLGSMINTLIFAYIGTSLVTVLILSESEMGLLEILNQGYIAEEIVRSLVGAFGLLAVIPFTALLGGLVYGKKRNVKNK